MSNEINHKYTFTGATLYFVVENSAGLIWNGTTFVSLAVADWANYDIAMTETPASGYRYLGSMPSVAAGKYTISVFRRLGSTPAINDELLAMGNIGWTGSAECSLLNYLSDTIINYRSAYTTLAYYATLELITGGTIWNGSALEAMAVANWANYDIALTETPAGSYRYIATLPALSTGRYKATIYKRAGASPAITDEIQSVGEVVVFASSTPIRTQILTALAARLATITVANGYRTDLGDHVEEWTTTPLDQNVTQYRIKYHDETEDRVQQTVGEQDMTLDITLQIETVEATPLAVMRNMIADVTDALYTDVSLGSLCDDIVPNGAVKFDKAEAADTAVGAVMKYQILYSVNKGES